MREGGDWWGGFERKKRMTWTKLQAKNKKTHDFARRLHNRFIRIRTNFRTQQSSERTRAYSLERNLFEGILNFVCPHFLNDYFFNWFNKKASIYLHATWPWKLWERNRWMKGILGVDWALGATSANPPNIFELMTVWLILTCQRNRKNKKGHHERNESEC